ncbi:MAG: hypothetical protein LBB56_07940, partial [Chitinispirillales bacterium]|nr:hypothetical protein [Chitinispirillales bacterium]
MSGTENKVFSNITSITVPKEIFVDEKSNRNKPFEIKFEADGVIPFPQVIIRENGREHLFNGSAVVMKNSCQYSVLVP